MSGAGRETARTIVGIIGNVSTFFMFASPSPTLWRIVKKKSTEEFRVEPYAVTALNSLIWTFYGIPVVQTDAYLIATINSIGILLEFAYLLIFFLFSTNQKRVKILCWLCIDIIVFGVMAVITLRQFDTYKTRTTFVGVFGAAISILMYASPLTAMTRVLKTKSVEFMPLYISVAGFLNATVWLAYSLIKFDIFMAIPNILGVVVGAIQLIIYSLYYNTSVPTGHLKPSTEIVNGGCDHL